MPDHRDPATQYAAEEKRPGSVSSNNPALVDLSWPNLLNAFAYLRKEWAGTLDGLGEAEARRLSAAADAWTPAQVVNHQGGTLEQAAIMIRAAVRGVDQVLSNLDGQWLGDDIAWNDLLSRSEQAMEEFAAAANAASMATGFTGTVTSPYLNRGPVRHWVRNMLIHTAEHVVQMRKLRGTSPGAWSEVGDLYHMAMGVQ